MYRKAIAILNKWKISKNRKPLIIRGARQVGKTWLMKEFGTTEYDEMLYINFDHNQDMESLFQGDLDTYRIVTGLELFYGKKINPATTLLVFDEIQEVPNALASLKYFNENAPEYQIICAGSLLGVALHPGTSFPVGKVDFVDLYPLNFEEFLMAMGYKQYAELLQNKDYKMATNFSTKFIEMLRYYYFVGGMPEVVRGFSSDRDFNEARKVQKRILQAYEQDFSKHAPTEVVPRIRMLWNSIPVQLSKENKKFIYGLIKEGARAKEYEMALLWLQDCGLVHKVSRVNTPNLPLKAYEDLKAFKLFILDIGLLSCMSSLRQKTVIEGNRLFVEFKGALTEQYVLQQLMTKEDYNIFYWSNERGTNEIDFLVDDGNDLVPVEVKAEENLTAKSLKAFCEKYHPEKAVRTSMSGYREEEWMTNLPLYCIGSGWM